jgi:hypothetical protein
VGILPRYPGRRIKRNTTGMKKTRAAKKNPID